MEDKLIEILESFGYPVIRQGSLSQDDAYPDSFFTFWNGDSYDKNHYDNRENGVVYWFDVNFYSKNPKEAYEALNKARKKLKENDFKITGRGYDMASDEITHIGRGMQVAYLDY